MLKQKEWNELYVMLSPSYNDIHDFVDGLNDIIDNCDNQEDREELTIAIDHINLAIISMMKVLNKKEDK